MSRILVLDTGTQGYITVKSLKKAGHYVCLLYKHKHNYADDSKYVDVKIQTDAAYEDAAYLTTVQRIITEQGIEAVIPMSDFSSQFSKYSRNFSLSLRL